MFVTPFYHVPITGSSGNRHKILFLQKSFGTYDFRSKGHRSRSQWSFEIFVVSALRLHVYLTDLPYTWHKYSPRRENVLQSISMSKGQRSSSHRSFEMAVTLVIRSFCCVCSRAPSPFWVITFIYSMHTTHQGTMCRAPFSWWKVKCQGTWVVWSF